MSSCASWAFRRAAAFIASWVMAAMAWTRVRETTASERTVPTKRAVSRSSRRIPAAYGTGRSRAAISSALARRRGTAALGGSQRFAARSRYSGRGVAKRGLASASRHLLTRTLKLRL